MPVARTRFEHANGRVLAQTVGEDAAGGAGTDNDVIERVHDRFFSWRMLLSANRCPLLRNMRYSAAATAEGSV